MKLFLKHIFVISCRKATELISLRHDNDIGLIANFRLNLHLRICKACTRFSKQLDLLHHAAHHHAHKEMEHNDTLHLPEEVRNRIKQEITSFNK